jgi:hypothetical protein
MFIQMDKEREDLIKSTGKLLFNVHPFVDNCRDRDRLEHVITYHNKQLDCYPSSIFRCLVTKNHDILLIDDLTLRTKGTSVLNEESLYLFLGWVIADAPKWAKMFGKKFVLIQTKLPHCTEWFVEHNYDLYPLKSTIIKGYRGMKKILENSKE